MEEVRDVLKCEVVRLEYDFVAKVGLLHLAPDNCCDMAGCIDVFKAIDPHVQMINTFSGDTPDITYVRVSGHWRTFNNLRSDHERSR